jgi:high-affinity iron transporter
MHALSIAVQSGSILVREGLEALLIIAALEAFLRKSGAGARTAVLYAGALAALIASVIAAIIFEVYFSGAHDDRVEAAVMVVAAALMLYMSGWLFLRQDPARWKATLQANATRALATGTTLSLASLAFLAVFREGAETMLFLHALAGTNGGWSFGLIGGIAGGFALLIGLYGAMQWLAYRLPLRPLFMVTSAFLFVMGLRMIGGAVQELQEQVLVPIHEAPGSDWLLTLGFNPTWEAIALQLAVACVVVVGTVISAAQMPRSTA